MRRSGLSRSPRRDEGGAFALTGHLLSAGHRHIAHLGRFRGEEPLDLRISLIQAL
ncbi:hypothetical protein [Streptomyces herbicida]|uniref:hypothetical protein n=1 Tax=Streptomyces herbicida TaxID=3065675 RepID=UPI00292D9563|nr:hypothetical protein [Streptomyces sp. NEAU-HV9]